jgi:solute carrier family 25 (mitochondrial carnitine/acylcarnitine transporter), member 20/29
LNLVSRIKSFWGESSELKSLNNMTSVNGSTPPLSSSSSFLPLKNPALINYLAGVCGGVSVVLVGHPFDTTKTRMQTAPQGYYRNTVDVVKQTWKFEGLRGFYKGMMSPLSGQMFFRAASFMTFYASLDKVSTMCNDPIEKPSSFATVIAGASTGFIIAFIETPIDVIKTKLQIQIFRQRLHPEIKSRYRNVTGCVQYIIRKHGTKALWQGLQATVIRNVPANAMFFPVNELVKVKLANDANMSVSDLPMSQKLTAGATAGLCYWTLCYPLDAVKGRIMAQSFKRRHNYIHVIKTMKPMDFFWGIIPSAARGALACAAMFYTVDVVRIALSENQ